MATVSGCGTDVKDITVAEIARNIDQPTGMISYDDTAEGASIFYDNSVYDLTAAEFDELKGAMPHIEFRSSEIDRDGEVVNAGAVRSLFPGAIESLLSTMQQRSNAVFSFTRLLLDDDIDRDYDFWVDDAGLLFRAYKGDLADVYQWDPDVTAWVPHDDTPSETVESAQNSTYKESMIKKLTESPAPTIAPPKPGVVPKPAPSRPAKPARHPNPFRRKTPHPGHQPAPEKAFFAATALVDQVLARQRTGVKEDAAGDLAPNDFGPRSGRPGFGNRARFGKPTVAPAASQHPEPAGLYQDEEQDEVAIGHQLIELAERNGAADDDWAKVMDLGRALIDMHSGQV